MASENITFKERIKEKPSLIEVKDTKSPDSAPKELPTFEEDLSRVRERFLELIDQKNALLEVVKENGARMSEMAFRNLMLLKIIKSLDLYEKGCVEERYVFQTIREVKEQISLQKEEEE